VIPPRMWMARHTLTLAASLPAPDNPDRLLLLGEGSAFLHCSNGVGKLRLTSPGETVLTVWREDEFVFGCWAESAREGVSWSTSGRTEGELWGTPPADIPDDPLRLAGVISYPGRPPGLVIAEFNSGDPAKVEFEIYHKPVAVFAGDCVFFTVAGSIGKRLSFPRTDFRFRRSTGEPVRWTDGVLVAPSSPCEISYEARLGEKMFAGTIKVLARPLVEARSYSCGKWSVLFDPVSGVCSRESFGPGKGLPIARLYAILSGMDLGVLYPYFYAGDR
jgi:hypothetical protein